MLPHQFRENAPCQLRSSYGTRTTPLFPRQHNSPKRKGGNERVTGSKARGPQAAGGNKLQVANDFFLLYTKLKEASTWIFLELTNVFFLQKHFSQAMLMKLCIYFGIGLSSKWFHLRLFPSSNLGLIMAQQTSILSIV